MSSALIKLQFTATYLVYSALYIFCHTSPLFPYSNEMMIIIKSSIIKAVNESMYATYQPMMMFAVFSVYAAMGECITLRKVFISFLLLSSIKLFCNFYLVLGISRISEGIVAIKRIQVSYYYVTYS